MTPLLAIALIAFFVLVFGPIAYWVLARSGSQSFDVGIEAVSQLPTAYLMQTIAIVAPAEELLYRSYAIARLSDLTGSWLLASIVSVVSLGLAHAPMWGWAPAATTIVSGGIGTAVYLWRQDIVALILAHIATDLYGIVLASHLAHAIGKLTEALPRLWRQFVSDNILVTNWPLAVVAEMGIPVLAEARGVALFRADAGVSSGVLIALRRAARLPVPAA